MVHSIGVSIKTYKEVPPAVDFVLQNWGKTNKYESGTKLRIPIYDNRDVLLLAEGQTITPNFLEKIRNRNIAEVKVHESELARVYACQSQGGERVVPEHRASIRTNYETDASRALDVQLLKSGALGMPPGLQALGRSEVTIGEDGVRLADGTLAGSNLAMDQGVRNLVAYSRSTPAAALHAASTAPAAVLGDTTRGTLAPGARADLVLLTEDLELVATVVGGEVLHEERA